MGSSDESAVAGADLSAPLDAIFVNAPLRDYDKSRRLHDFTLPVLGVGYIATVAARAGYNVGVVDAEALGLGLTRIVQLINGMKPRWLGLNLLAPTYEWSATIADQADETIDLMVGGHHAKAMPDEVLNDARFRNMQALILGEAETRVCELLADLSNRERLPAVRWKDRHTGEIQQGSGPPSYLAPDLSTMPHLDRRFLVGDPRETPDGRIESNLVGARGCPYDCAFCGAAVSANPDVTIRTRDPGDIVDEMNSLNRAYGVTAFRFVDDLFLGHERFIRECMATFGRHNVGASYVWDATGRINILDRMDDELLDVLAANGCREVALGIESGSERLLTYMGKRITPAMTERVVARLTERAINVKGYVILGYPTETAAELEATVTHVERLWSLADRCPGEFRVSAFEFRPYPGTPEWDRLIASGKYLAQELVAYTVPDLSQVGADDAMRQRDEFNFSVNIQFGEVPIDDVRAVLAKLTRLQYERRVEGR